MLIDRVTPFNLNVFLMVTFSDIFYIEQIWQTMDGGERSIVNDVKEWVEALQASVVAAGHKMIEDVLRLQEHNRMSFIRNKSIKVLINNHFGHIEIEVKQKLRILYKNTSCSMLI